MRTTVDIPEPLLRRAKAAAALQGKSLRVFVQDAIERQLRTAGETARRRVSLPLVPSKSPGTLSLSDDEVARALEAEDVDAFARR